MGQETGEKGHGLHGVKVAVGAVDDAAAEDAQDVGVALEADGDVVSGGQVVEDRAELDVPFGELVDGDGEGLVEELAGVSVVELAGGRDGDVEVGLDGLGGVGDHDDVDVAEGDEAGGHVEGEEGFACAANLHEPPVVN